MRSRSSFARRVVAEALEAKQVLSFVDSAGVLTYWATGGKDSLGFTQSGSTITATDFATQKSETHAIGSAKVFKIALQAGNDYCYLGSSTTPLTIPVSVNGGGGDDTIQGGASGTPTRPDTIRGEFGNDSLILFKGYGDFDGGADADTITGSNGGAFIRDNDTRQPASAADKSCNDVFRVYTGSTVNPGYGDDEIWGLDSPLRNGPPLVDGKYGIKVQPLVASVGTSVNAHYGRDKVAGWKLADFIDYHLNDDPVSVVGNAGNDEVYVRAGSTVDAGVGNDTVNGYGLTDASVTLGDGDDKFYTNGLTNTVTVKGGAGNDWIMAGNSTGTYSRLTADDGPGNDIVAGTGGNDDLVSGGGFDQLIANGGDDQIAYTQGNNVVGGAGSDLISYVSLGSATGDETDIDGGEGNDTIFGTNGFDSIVGGPGNDFLTGKGGNDTYAFGAVAAGGEIDRLYEDANGGVDTLDFSQAPSSVSIHLNSKYMGVSAGRSVESGSVPGYQNFENAIGSKFNDAFYGNANANLFRGGDGADQFFMAGDFGKKDTAYGGAGSDILSSKDGDDLIYEVP